MKLKNISQRALKVPLMKKFSLEESNRGNKKREVITVILNPGQYIHSDNGVSSKQAHIYVKKRCIQTIEEPLPNGYEYYKVYDDTATPEVSKSPVSSGISTHEKITESVEDIIDNVFVEVEEKDAVDIASQLNKDIKSSENENGDFAKQIAKDAKDILAGNYDNIEETTSKPENKRGKGRPAGSLNKPKSDKPKRPRGRPAGSLNKPKESQ